MLLTIKKEIDSGVDKSSVHANLASLINWIMARDDISRGQLGDRIGISSQTLANWVDLKSDPQLTKIMALAKINGWTFTEFVARLETGLIETKVMPINKVFSLFSGITSGTQTEKVSTEALLTHLKEAYTPSTTPEICAVLSEVLTLYLGRLTSEQGHPMNHIEQFDLGEEDLKRLRILIQASLEKRGINEAQASRNYDLSPLVFRDIFNEKTGGVIVMRSVMIKLGKLCYRVSSWQNSLPVLEEESYLIPEELLSDLRGSTKNHSG